MHKLLSLILLVGSLQAQVVFFDEPRISGTALIPQNESAENYVNNLKNSNPTLFSKITAVRAPADDIGDERNFNVRNLINPEKVKLDNKTFVLKKTNASLNIWVEKGELENGHVTDQVIEQIFDGLILSTPSGSIDSDQGIFRIIISVFGEPPDVDNSQKVDFLLTDIKDGWDEDRGEFIGGFFYPFDQGSGPGSNQADILYIDTYPNIYNGTHHNINGALSTVAHEFQHLVQFANDPNEETWINEGLSEISSFLCGYGLRSPGQFLQNSQLGLSAWNNSESLPHYSKVALWTFFLYERYGQDIITKISEDPLPGMNGVQSALVKAGFTSNIEDVVLSFFKILASNDPALSDNFFYDESLQYLRSLAQKRITEYPSLPSEGSFTIAPFSMQSVELTNGDSLQITFNSFFNNTIYLNRFGFGNDVLLTELNPVNFYEDDFGKSYHTAVLYFINTSASSALISFTAQATTKNDLITLQYGNDEADFLISSNRVTNAVKYISPRDTAFIKTVSFYQSGRGDDIRIHQYDSEVLENSNPTSVSRDYLNGIIPGWVDVDVEDLKKNYNSGDFFNAGVQFLGDGALGYSDAVGEKHNDRSFIKSTDTGEPFRLLSDFSINNSSLDGAWMIKLEVAAPYTGRSVQGSIADLLIFPNPFSNTNNNSLTIQYLGSGSSPVDLHIYNSLGQTVYSAKNEPGKDSFAWEGKNNRGQSVASGSYFISAGTKSKKIYSRVVVLR